jgi:hypothetical protein
MLSSMLLERIAFGLMVSTILILAAEALRERQRRP